jgi:hypothetical protein
MHGFSLFAASAALTLCAAWPVLADEDVPDDAAPPVVVQDVGNNTTFDLGIDVSGVAHNPAAVHAFMLGLAPVTQDAIMGACATFMDYPVTAQSPETWAFCANTSG